MTKKESLLKGIGVFLLLLVVYAFLLGWSQALKAIPALILFAIPLVFPTLSKPTKYLLIAASFISLLIFTGKTKAILESLLFLGLGFLLLYAGLWGKND